MLRRVDLPAPDNPTMAAVSPRRTVKETSCRTVSGSARPRTLNCLVTPVTSMAASGPAGPAGGPATAAGVGSDAGTAAGAGGTEGVAEGVTGVTASPWGRPGPHPACPAAR